MNRLRYLHVNPMPLPGILRKICTEIAILLIFLALGSPAIATNQTDPVAATPKTAVGTALVIYTSPTIVLQTLERGQAPQMATWSKDDKYVIVVLENSSVPSTKRESGIGQTLVVWEIATGHILHRERVPSGSNDETMRLNQLSIDEYGKVRLSVVLQTKGSPTCRKRTLTYRPGGSESWDYGFRPDDEGPCEVKKSDYPRSHGGNLRLMDTSRGLAVFDESKGGTLVQVLEKPELIIIGDAELSPDGRWLAMNMARARQSEKYTTNIILFDILSSNYGPAISIGSRESYDHVLWMGPNQILLPEREEREGAYLFDTRTGKQIEPRIEGHCRLTPLDEQTLVGSAHANCFWPEAGESRTGPQGLRRYVLGQGWQNLNEDDFKGRVIDKIAASPDRKSLAVLTRNRKTQKTIGERHILIIDTGSGQLTNQTLLDRPEYGSDGRIFDEGPVDAQGRRPIIWGDKTSFAWSHDGRRIFFSTEKGRRYHWQPAPELPIEFTAEQAPINPLSWRRIDDQTEDWIDFDEVAGTVTKVEIAPGWKNGLRKFDLNENVVGAGLIPQYGFSWEMTANGGLFVRDVSASGNDSRKYGFRTLFLDNRRFLTIGGTDDQQGDSSYDTNLQADTDLVRWEWRNQPFSSFGPQTFMRDNFQPQLAKRYLECSRAYTCDQITRKSMNMRNINTTLPSVTIDRIVAEPTPNMATVTMTIREGLRTNREDRRLYDDNNKTRSGIYNLRLFRNGALVGQFPEVNEEKIGREITSWRDANRLKPGPDGTVKVTLRTALPTATESTELTFTAYAFNEDRIKSETAKQSYVAPAVANPRKRRAFIISIGIDEYVQSRLALRFAAADARIISERLAAIPDYQVATVALLGTKVDSKPLHISKDMIAATLGILAGAPRDAALKRLAAMGVDARTLKKVAALDKATPDDIVIISYAGHGWADKQGNFYLIPSDGLWPDDKPEPVIPSLLSTATTTNWLRQIDAGEIAFIIDACHAGASVDAGGFKPGPMGDPGLGQLAFDKGIRILAATQGGDVAIEDASKGHGLLTYALVQEGLTESGGKADLDGNGAILLDEWLGYGVKQTTSLVDQATVQARDRTDDSGFSFPNRDRIRKEQSVQQPSLFDFNGKASGVVLKTGIK